MTASDAQAEFDAKKAELLAAVEVSTVRADRDGPLRPQPHPHHPDARRGGGERPCRSPTRYPRTGLVTDPALEVELLERQLARMRGMLGTYSALSSCTCARGPS